MVTLKFYLNKSLDNVLNKSLADMTEGAIPGVFVEPYNEENPSIRVDKQYMNFDFNYFSVQDGSKITYYFLRNITWESSRIAIISGEIDLLMTYNDYIKNMKGIVGRSTDSGNNYIVDNNMILSAVPSIRKIPLEVDEDGIPKGFSGNLDDGVYLFNAFTKPRNN